MTSQDRFTVQVLLLTDKKQTGEKIRQAMVADSLSVCTGTKEAETRLAVERYSVVLVDDSLTDGTLSECCQRLLNRQRNFPLIVLASEGAEAAVLGILAAGVEGFIIKDKDDAYLTTLPGVVSTTIRRFRSLQTSVVAQLDTPETQVGLAQIMDGSPVATFILDRDHRVTYWNRACEELTGVSRASIIGTRNQWRPFYSGKRLVLADLIVDGKTEAEINAHYAGTCRASQTINGAYEAENYFPNFGEDGRWLFFTAAPLRDANGNVAGAIETLQDVSGRVVAETALKIKAEEEALRTSSYFQEVMDNLPFSVLVLDRSLDTIYWNGHVENIFGLPHNFILRGMSVKTIARRIAENGCYGPGDIDEQVKARFKKLGTFQPHAIELVRPGGGTLLERGTPVMLMGEPVGFILLQEDITERKQDEQLARQREMEKSLATLRSAVSNINQGLVMFDADLNLEICNQLYMELYGYPEHLAHPGTPFSAFARHNAERGDYGPGDINDLVASKIQTVATLKPHHYERERPDGRVIEVVGKPLTTGGFISTHTDITDRKRHEIELQEFNTTLEQRIAERTENLHQALSSLGLAQGRLAQIIDGSPVAAFVIDHEYNITHWNRACENLTGVAAIEILGSNYAWRCFYETQRPTLADLIVSGETGEQIDRFYTNKWRRSEIIQGALEAEDFYPRLGETGRWVAFTAAPLRDKDGNVIGAIETLRDITAQRMAESALNERAVALQKALEDLGAVIKNLEQTQDELVRSEKMAALGSMVAGIAHELNTPIGNSLMVASHLVETSQRMGEAVKAGLKKSMLDEFLANTNSTGDVLVRNLSKAAELVASFKQVAVDQTSSKRRRFDLSSMVSEVLTTLGPSLRKTPYVVEKDIPDGIVLESYPGPLGQVVTNLVNNAVIHGFDGRKTGRILIQATGGKDEQPVVLTINDNGGGIPTHILPKIFDPFFTTKLGQGGSGLGLNIVHNMVFGMLGGRIVAESTPSTGTSFIITLPCTAPAQGESEATAAKAETPRIHH